MLKPALAAGRVEEAIFQGHAVQLPGVPLLEDLIDSRAVVRMQVLAPEFDDFETLEFGPDGMPHRSRNRSSTKARPLPKSRS